MKKYIVITLVFIAFLGAGIASYFLFWGPELPRALRKMDRLNSVTISFTGGRILIEGANAKYILNDMDPFYCKFDGTDFSCYDQDGDSYSPNQTGFSVSETGSAFNRFADFIKFDCEYSTALEKYVCANNQDPDAEIHAVRFVVKDGYISSMDIFVSSYIYNGFVTFTFSKYNQTDVNMP